MCVCDAAKRDEKTVGGAEYVRWVWNIRPTAVVAVFSLLLFKIIKVYNIKKLYFVRVASFISSYIGGPLRPSPLPPDLSYRKRVAAVEHLNLKHCAPPGRLQQCVFTLVARVQDNVGQSIRERTAAAQVINDFRDPPRRVNKSIFSYCPCRRLFRIRRIPINRGHHIHNEGIRIDFLQGLFL